MTEFEYCSVAQMIMKFILFVMKSIFALLTVKSTLHISSDLDMAPLKLSTISYIKIQISREFLQHPVHLQNSFN